MDDCDGTSLIWAGSMPAAIHEVLPWAIRPLVANVQRNKVIVFFISLLFLGLLDHIVISFARLPDLER